jgi:hypothetical protein
MKKIFLALISVTAFTAALPAFAGPDWQIIEHGRKVKAERMRQEQAQRVKVVKHNKRQQPDDETEKDRMMKACMEMMAKSKQQPGQ